MLNQEFVEFELNLIMNIVFFLSNLVPIDGLYNPLNPSVEYSLHLTKILILKYEGIIKKIPMSDAPMSRLTLGTYFGLLLRLLLRCTESSTQGLKGIMHLPLIKLTTESIDPRRYYVQLTVNGSRLLPTL